MRELKERRFNEGPKLVSFTNPVSFVFRDENGESDTLLEQQVEREKIKLSLAKLLYRLLSNVIEFRAKNACDLMEGFT